MIKKLTTITVIAVAAITFTACSGEKKAQTKTYAMSAEQVYTSSCTKCHGANGEGNTQKKTPALNDRTAGEMAQDLYDIKSGGTGYGGSGTEHDIMEHNMQKLIDQGFDYDINAMADYMSKLKKQ